MCDSLSKIINYFIHLCNNHEKSYEEVDTYILFFYSYITGSRITYVLDVIIHRYATLVLT